MTAPTRRLRAGRRPAAVLSGVGILGLMLSGCGDPEPEPTIPEIAQPPNRELPEPALVAGADLPVRALSAQCDEPRPPGDEVGLRVPAPVPDEDDVAFFVPAAEQALCELPGVVSASLSGSYAAQDGARAGGAELGLLFAPEATPAQVQQAWSTGIEQSRLQLSGTEISLETVTLLLDDGSAVVGPAQQDAAPVPAGPVPPAAGPAATTPEAIALLAALQAAAPAPQEDTGAEEQPVDPAASASASASTAPPPPPQRRWSLEVGPQLELTTVYAADLAAEDALPQLRGVLEDSQEVADESSSAPRRDAVTVIDGRMELTAQDAQIEALTPQLLADLHDLGQVPDLQATASLETTETGRPVLRVRSQRLPEYTQPKYEEAAAALETSAAQAGVQVDHRLDGERLPLEEDQAD